MTTQTYPEKVFNYLEANSGRLVTCEELYSVIWGVQPYGAYRNNVRNAVSQARHMCESEEQIHAVRGVGYVYWKRGKHDRKNHTLC